MKKFSFIMIGCVLVSLWVFLFFAEDSAKVLLRVSVNDCRIKVIHVSDYSLAAYVDGEYTQTLHLDPLEGEEIKLLEVSTADISFDGFFLGFQAKLCRQRTVCFRGMRGTNGFCQGFARKKRVTDSLKRACGNQTCRFSDEKNTVVSHAVTAHRGTKHFASFRFDRFCKCFFGNETALDEPFFLCFKGISAVFLRKCTAEGHNAVLE